MPLTEQQRRICRLIAENRIASGESYVAGGAALSELLQAQRVSRDVDLFHDTDAALQASWRADRALLEGSGFDVIVVREHAAFVEADIVSGADRVRMEWARDSAFRFFPLLRHDDLGLTLHPFDLATNKVLALVGRLEVRDWIDVISCHDRVQPLGYLAWAACGKDAGFSPAGILADAWRSGRYSAAEVQQLVFSGTPPDAAELSRRWREMLDTARQVVAVLPPDEVGTCVLTATGELLRLSPPEIELALRSRRVVFHRGSIRGALPRIRE